MITSPFFGIGLMIGISAIGGTIFMMMPEEQTPQVAKISGANILAEHFSEDGIPVLSLGKSVLITMQVEKISDYSVRDIMVKTQLENSHNGEYLLINKATIHAGLQSELEDFLDYTTKGMEVNAFEKDIITEPMVIQATVTNMPGKPMQERIILTMYADGQIMEQTEYDIIISNKKNYNFENLENKNEKTEVNS